MEKQTAYDFFSSQKLTPKDPVVLRMWAMLLFSLNKATPFFTKNNPPTKFLFPLIWLFLAVCLVSAVNIATNDFHNEQKMLVIQDKNLAPAKVPQSQQSILKEQQLAYVKSLNELQMKEIIEHLKKSRAAEQEKIKRLYWSALYINENVNKISMQEVTKNVLKLSQQQHIFYENRLYELNRTYYLVQNNQENLIAATHDSDDPLPKILNWHHYTKAGVIPFTDMEEVRNMWLKYLTDPVQLQQYLEKNKKAIAETSFDNF